MLDVILRTAKNEAEFLKLDFQTKQIVVEKHGHLWRWIHKLEIWILQYLPSAFRRANPYDLTAIMKQLASDLIQPANWRNPLFNQIDWKKFKENYGKHFRRTMDGDDNVIYQMKIAQILQRTLFKEDFFINLQDKDLSPFISLIKKSIRRTYGYLYDPKERANRIEIALNNLYKELLRYSIQERNELWKFAQPCWTNKQSIRDGRDFARLFVKSLQDHYPDKYAISLQLLLGWAAVDATIIIQQIPPNERKSVMEAATEFSQLISMKGIRLQDVVILLQDLDADDRQKFLSTVKQSLPELNQIDDGYTQVEELRLIAANLSFNKYSLMREREYWQQRMSFLF